MVIAFRDKSSLRACLRWGKLTRNCQYCKKSYEVILRNSSRSIHSGCEKNLHVIEQHKWPPLNNWALINSQPAASINWVIEFQSHGRGRQRATNSRQHDRLQKIFSCDFIRARNSRRNAFFLSRHSNLSIIALDSSEKMAKTALVHFLFVLMNWKPCQIVRYLHS